jgi:hypothetical protein
MHLMDQRPLNFDYSVKTYLLEYSGWNTEDKYRQTKLIKDLLIDSTMDVLLVLTFTIQ